MMIRDKYWEALDGKLSLNIMETEEGELLTRQMLHINHCFDYIRQGIMCAGDMSLEGAIKGTADLQPTDDLRRINGWGSSHECKNFVSFLVGGDYYQYCAHTILASFKRLDGRKCSRDVKSDRHYSKVLGDVSRDYLHVI